MKFAVRLIFVSVAGLVAVSLVMALLGAWSPVAAAGLVAGPNHQCCCGVCDGKGCGMACCQPSQPPPAVPPIRTLGHFKSLLLASWHAPAMSSPAGIEQGFHRAWPLAHVRSQPTLQSEHVRMQT